MLEKLGCAGRSSRSDNSVVKVLVQNVVEIVFCFIRRWLDLGIAAKERRYHSRALHVIHTYGGLGGTAD